MFINKNKKTFKIKKWEVDPIHNTIKQGKVVHEIESKAMEVLVYLAQHPHRIISFLEFKEIIWPGQDIKISALSRIISNLRTCLGDNAKSPNYILTVKNTGYRFIAETSLEGYSPQISERADFNKSDGQHLYFKLSVVILFSIALFFVNKYFLISAPPMKMLNTQYIMADRNAGIGPTLSPDGNKVVYFKGISMKDNAQNLSAMLFLKNIKSNKVTQLTHLKGFASHPAWSPNNRHIAFSYEFSLTGMPTDYAIYTMNTKSNSVEVLTQTLSHTHGLSWSPDGKYLAFTDGPHNISNFLYQLNTTNKEKELIAKPADSKDFYSYPNYSPDGKFIAAIRTNQGAFDNIDLIDTKNHSSRTVLSNQRKISSISWKDDQILFVALGGAASSQLFELSISNGKLTKINIVDNNIEYLSYSKSARRLVFESIQTPYNIHYAEYRDDGLRLIDKGGLTAASIRQQLEAAQSPDQRYTALISSRSGRFEIWLIDNSSGQSKQLTDIQAISINGLDWSPHSDRLAFVATIGNKTALYWMFLENKQLHRFAHSDSNLSLVGWENKDSSLLFSSNPDGEWKLWRLNTNNNDTELVSTEPIIQGRLSPDRKMLYFVKYNHPGIWSTRLKNIAPVLIPGTESINIYRSWTVTEKGIFYAIYGNNIGNYDELYFQSFNENKPILAMKIPRLHLDRIYWANGRLFFSVYDYRRSNIVMIENL